MSEWPDPTQEMLDSKAFEAVWQRIKRWDINVPGVYVGYMSATGNHVRAILDALSDAGLCVVEDQREADRRRGAAPVRSASAVASLETPEERNRRQLLEERQLMVEQVADLSLAAEILRGLEREYANYNAVELKLVDPRTVTHIRRDISQRLCEITDAPAAVAIIVTRKNHTETPVYFPLKRVPTPAQLTAVGEHFANALEKDNVRMLVFGSGCPD